MVENGMNLLQLANNLIGGAGTQKKMSKAYLEVYGERGTKRIPCLFNPGSYTIRQSVEYRRVRALGSDAELKQFAGCNASVLEVTLFFDTLMCAEGDGSSGEGSAAAVTDYTKDIIALASIDGKLHRPARVGFVWGKLNFVGVLTSAEETFLMFAKDGKPLREKISIHIEAVTPRGSARKSPWESPDRTKYVQWTEGMSLWALAQEEYGDCEEWKRIAEANGIENPLEFNEKRLLKIPALIRET